MVLTFGGSIPPARHGIGSRRPFFDAMCIDRGTAPCSNRRAMLCVRSPRAHEISRQASALPRLPSGRRPQDVGARRQPGANSSGRAATPGCLGSGHPSSAARSRTHVAQPGGLLSFWQSECPELMNMKSAPAAFPPRVQPEPFLFCAMNTTESHCDHSPHRARCGNFNQAAGRGKSAVARILPRPMCGGPVKPMPPTTRNRDTLICLSCLDHRAFTILQSGPCIMCRQSH